MSPCIVSKMRHLSFVGRSGRPWTPRHGTTLSQSQQQQQQHTMSSSSRIPPQYPSQTTMSHRQFQTMTFRGHRPRKGGGDRILSSRPLLRSVNSLTNRVRALSSSSSRYDPWSFSSLQDKSTTTHHHDDTPNTFEVRPPPKGTGFDNFLPRDKEGDKGSKQEQGSGNGGNNNNNNNNNDNTNLWLSLAGLLALVAYLARQREEEPVGGGSSTMTTSGTGIHAHSHAHHQGMEITWSDFLRLLQQRDIVKVVIDDNKTTARVYIRANAVGLSGSNHLHQQGGGDFGASAYELQRRRLQQQQQQQQQTYQEQNGTHHDGGGDGDMNDLSTSTSIEMTTSNSSSSMIGSAGSHSPLMLYYRMQIGSIESFERKLDEAQRGLGRLHDQDVPVQYTADTTLGREMLATVPGLLMALLLFAMIRFANTGGAAGGFGGGASGGGRGGMGGIFQIGKSTHKKIAQEDVKVRFKDVAGCDQAKREIMEFVDFLKDSDRFTKLGAKIPKGALLCGPPGTGKTLLAKAVAGEAGVPFYTISGSDFIEMFVGVGPSRVRDLFQEARQNSPCIVFIDEIDAVGRQRGRGGVGGNDERENTLNQLLVEMDGFEPSTGVVVLAGTNRVDILDQALTRPGRFDRQITVDKPDLQGRKAIFKVHLDGIKLEDDMDDIAGRLAGLTPGFAGADIANICNEAAIVAARRKGESVTLEDFEKATDRIIGGLESNKIMSKEERSIVAHHEAGHAVAGWFLEHADPLLKVTIIPRSSGALGFAQYLPKEVFLRTQNQIMDIVCMALAGRAAEEIFFGRVTTGASDDLKRVTELVYSTIQLYGMNNRVGQLSFPKDPNAMFEERPYSEKTAKAMDEEARAIVDAAYQRTLDLLREKKDEVEKVAHLLLDKETITHDDIIDIIGPRPFKGDPAYEEYIRRKEKDKVEHEHDTKDDKASDDSQEIDGPLSPGLASMGLPFDNK